MFLCLGKMFFPPATFRQFAEAKPAENKPVYILAEDLPEGVLLADGEGVPWTEKRLEELSLEYHAEHGNFRLDVEGRSLKHTVALWTADSLKIQQILQDDEDLNDWEVDFSIPLSEAREAGMPLLRLDRIGIIQ